MTSIRLLAFALLLSSPLLGQVQTQATSDLALASSAVTPAQKAIAETWRIPERLPEASATDAAVASLSGNLDKGISIFPSGNGSGDLVCLMIRSYVVARDSKDSDATHFVRSSTCQLASRYQLKTTQMEHSGVLPSDAR
jgi:hypothetical protein